MKRACGLVSGPEPQRAVGDRGQEKYSDTLSLKKSLPEAGVGRGLGAANLHCLREAKAERTPGNNGSWVLLNSQLQTRGLRRTHSLTETNNNQNKSQHRIYTKKLQEKGKWSLWLTMGI